MSSFHLDLVAPDKLTFSGEVDQIDLPGSEGDFGVFAQHAPTVSLLRPGIITIYAGGTQTKYVVMGGFVEVSPRGAVTVLADTAATPENFNRAELQARIAELESTIKAMPQGSPLDREITRLDQFKAVSFHLEGTAMH